MALGGFKALPFRLLISFAATFPVNGDSFWGGAMPKGSPNGELARRKP
mgnify:CR=1